MNLSSFVSQYDTQTEAAVALGYTQGRISQLLESEANGKISHAIAYQLQDRSKGKIRVSHVIKKNNKIKKQLRDGAEGGPLG